MRATSKMWARRVESLFGFFVNPIKNVYVAIRHKMKRVFRYFDMSIIVFFLVMFGVISVMGYNLYFADSSFHYRNRTATPAKIEKAVQNECVKYRLQHFAQHNSGVITNGRINDAKEQCATVPVMEDQRRQLGIN